MQFDSDLVHSLCWQRTSSIIWLRGRVSSPPLSCYSVFPASLSFLLICLSCYSVFPATLSFLLLCFSCYSVFPATLCFLLLCVSCYSVFPATLCFLLLWLSCYSVFPATLCILPLCVIRCCEEWLSSGAGAGVLLITWMWLLWRVHNVDR